jgi:hypothetical protein
MSDPVYSQMIAVPGMKIAYHFQIAEGQMIAYEVAEDRTASLEDLNELLDRMGDAASRQKAKHDLPFARLRLKQNRRNQNGAQPLPTDINAVTQAQTTLQGIVDTIRFDELEIPRLEAIIAGRPLPAEPSDQPTVFSFSPAAE